MYTEASGSPHFELPPGNVLLVSVVQVTQGLFLFSAMRAFQKHNIVKEQHNDNGIVKGIIVSTATTTGYLKGRENALFVITVVFV